MDPGPRASAKEQPGKAPRVLPAEPCRGEDGRSVVVVVVTLVVSRARDLPDDAGLRDLDQRPVGRAADEPGPRIRNAEVADGPVIHQVQGAVRPEQDLDGPVDAADVFRKGLLRRGGGALGVPATRATVVVGVSVRRAAVEGEAREDELERLAALADVPQ